MKPRVKSALLYAVVISLVLMALVACWSEPDSSNPESTEGMSVAAW